MSEGQIIWAAMWTCCMAGVPRKGRAVFDPVFYAFSALGWVMAFGWGRLMVCTNC